MPTPEHLAKIRESHQKAFAPWDEEQDKALLASYKEMQRPTSGLSEGEWERKMMKEFGRQSGGIRARIQKLLEGGPIKYRKPKVGAATAAPRKLAVSTVTVSELKLSDEAKEALDLMENTEASVFLTGRAGTGKSTLLRYFREHTKKRVVVLAPTGVAAVNVNGQTLHSFFGFKPGTTLESVKKRFDKKAAIFKKLQTIVIDEVSMVRADMLDCIDKFLRLNGPFQSAPFGGVQMIFIGDLYQLPPVVSAEERGWLSHYASPYFFDAPAFRELDPHYIELTQIYRQQDPEFIEVLNAVRVAQLSDRHLEIINQRVQEEIFDDELPYVYLTTRVDMADSVNAAKLAALHGKQVVLSGYVGGAFKESMLPTAMELVLKEAAQVMLLNNDQQGRWVNGDIGIVQAFQKGDDGTTIVRVKLENGDEVEVTPFTWEKIKFDYNTKEEKIESEVDGSFTQYPLRLAWAVTIHKGQGKTFDRVVVDFGRGTFAHGQAYVALSRCRTLGGLILKSPLQSRHVFIDDRVVEFMKKFGEGR